MKRVFLLSMVLGLFLCIGESQAKDYSSKDCPVIGNTNSSIYHTPGGRYYAKMLRLNQDGGDNRRCFQSTASAKTSGYRASSK